MPSTGIEAAIKELEREEKNIQDAIKMLRSIHGARSNGAAAPQGTAPKRGRRKMSAAARRKISEAAKKRWAKVRAKAS
jgi:hypothetical protein